ncbi:hypothetical protein [Paraferrimonas sedimenticola]|uniref:Uncharacterized protein n=1 Tax=Paraferrimonas sedimenticola TaxID=375674 RepID=A0AA37RX69_9GAMM|nr:hypothetical protein [Paraferrimonas sedimenticola]GLP96994.1 hypothetical protein GCM10007895_23000 [Paraferrimonas sedimenticola]
MTVQAQQTLRPRPESNPVTGHQLFRSFRRKGITCAMVAKTLNLDVDKVYEMRQQQRISARHQRTLKHHFPQLFV